MNQNENPVFGRKVFFIEPQGTLISFVIPKLIEQEYEVYTVNALNHAKNYLRGNPDSIVFVCINANLTVSGWLNFIKSFEEDEVLSTMLVGVIVHRQQKSERELLMINAELPAGYLELQASPEAMTQMISNVLELNGAKGRRKYVRADCAGDRAIYVAYNENGQQNLYGVDNISSVGLAFRCDESHVAKFPENSVMRNCTLVLHGEKVPFEAAVIMTKLDGKKPIVVVLFMKGSVVPYKQVLQRFIAERIQYCMDLQFETIALDDTDYNTVVLQTSGNLNGPGLYSPSASGDNVIYADDVEILEELRELGDDTVG